MAKQHHVTDEPVSIAIYMNNNKQIDPKMSRLFTRSLRPVAIPTAPPFVRSPLASSSSSSYSIIIQYPIAEYARLDVMAAYVITRNHFVGFRHVRTRNESHSPDGRRAPVKIPVCSPGVLS